MPTVTTPLRPYTDFPQLKRRRERTLLAERVALYEEQQRIKKRLDDLNFELFGELRSVLPEDVKSVEFYGFQVTTLIGSARRTFDQKLAVTKTFACPCSKCRGKERITVPAKVVDSFYKLGKEPRPTVSVKKIKEKNGQVEGEDDGE
jgi:hypothetical protein